MFLEYYNLIEQPFGVTPDPRFLYLNRTYREALASLWYGIKEARGFMALVTHPGMGKTTLLMQLLHKLRISSARTVFLFQTCCSSLDLIRYLLLDLSIYPAPDLASMHQQLNDALVREARAGRQFVFVIDEAQNLSPSVLETVRLLSDFETPQGKLLQIILAGQPQLIYTLTHPRMLQLRQRISMATSIDPLTSTDVERYINHRLAIAGYQGAPLFSSAALEVISRASQGIPRNINNLCFGALSIGFAQQRKKINREIVEEVVADQKFETWQKRIERPNTTASKRTDTSTIRSFFVFFRPSTWNSWHVRRPTYLSALAGLLILVSMFLWGKRPELASNLFGKNKQVASLTAPIVALPAEDAWAEAARPAQETTLSAVRPKNRTITVQPGQTLRQICFFYIGTYGTRTVQELQAMNPELDPNHIEPGQVIQLPVRVSAPSSSEQNAEQKIAALRK